MWENGAGSPRLEVAMDGERARENLPGCCSATFVVVCGRHSVADPVSLLLGVSGKVNMQDAWGIIPVSTEFGIG